VRLHLLTLLFLVAGVLIGPVFAPPGFASPPAQPDPGFIFTVAGDYGFDENAADTLRLIGQTNPSFHLALGDLGLTEEAPEANWCAFVRSHVPASVPFQLVTGSEEADFGGEGHISNFAQCLPDEMHSTGQYPAQYYFDYQELARFFVLSPDLFIDDQYYYYESQDEQYQWVANAIDEARADGIQWIVVGIHKGCHSMGPYYCRVSPDLLNLLIDKRVDLVLSGHDRTYQRSKQLATGPTCTMVPVDWFNEQCVVDIDVATDYPKGAGTVFVVVGTAGAELYPIDEEDSERGYFITWMGANASPRHGFLQVAVSEAELTGEFVGSTPSSDFSDRFTILSPN
jgi:hypothetical protein